MDTSKNQFKKRSVGFNTINPYYEQTTPKILSTYPLDDEEYPNIIRKPHTFSSLVITMLIIVYIVFYSGINYSSPIFSNIKLTQEEEKLLFDRMFIFFQVLLLVIIFLGVTYFPDNILRRPHPMFWRVVYSVGIFYLICLLFFACLNVSDARFMLKTFDLKLNSKPIYKSYGEDCSLQTSTFPFITIKPIMDSFDMYVSAHLLGWFVKYLAIRNLKLAFFLSVLFEMMEITFSHWLPNFIECWWDQLILDIFGMNTLGIILGYFVVEYFKMKNYSKWYIAHKENEIITDDSLINLNVNINNNDKSTSCIGTNTSNILGDSRKQNQIDTNNKSFLKTSKPEEFLKYFTPNEVDVYEWEIFTSSYRYFTFLWLIVTVIGCDLSHFFLKSVLWLPITHKILAFRIFLWGFMCIIALREFYDYITNKNCKGLGPFVWLTQIILFVEWCIIIKFKEDLMDTPFPDKIYYFWMTVIFMICLIGIRLIIRDLYGILFNTKKQTKEERLVINVAYHN